MPPCTIIISPLLPEHLSCSHQAETEALEDRPSRTTQQDIRAELCRQNTHSLTAAETAGMAGLGGVTDQTEAMARPAESGQVVVEVALHTTPHLDLADAAAMDWW